MINIVIIGNGISGITAAREIRKKSNHKITVISEETTYFYSRTALMYIFMGHLKFENTQPYENWFWKKNDIELIQDKVLEVDGSNKFIKLESGTNLNFDKLIIATGSKPNKFGWPGQDLNGVQGLYHLQDLEKLEQKIDDIKTAVIVGGGLIGIELAEMLKSRGKKVIFLIRESSFWNNVLPAEESTLINRHISEHHIELIFEDELSAILSKDGINVDAIKTKAGREISCEFVGLTVGVSPNIDFIKGSAIEINKGVLIDKYFETSIEDIYAIGDCAEHREPPSGRRANEQIWYTGRIMGETLAHNICSADKKVYQPGIFFNSAKFLDIEYQTYGFVAAELDENTATFYWQHPTKNIAFRINYDKASEAVVGVNVFGIRMRHKVWEEWISEKKHVSFVMNNLSKANFDPEFFTRYEFEILTAFMRTQGDSVL